MDELMGCLLIGFGFERGNYFEGKFHCKWRHNKAIVALRALATGNLLSPIKIQFTDSIRDNFLIYVSIIIKQLIILNLGLA